MHDGGADIRTIQAILGHAKLDTTQIYTQVSLKKLLDTHRKTHPAEAFYVKGRDVLDRTWTDRAYMTPDHESCGSYEQEGEIRFYCIKDTGDLGKLEIQ